MESRRSDLLDTINILKIINGGENFIDSRCTCGTDGTPCRYCFVFHGLNHLEDFIEDSCRYPRAVVQAMEDIENNADDTLFISDIPTETVFDRLWSIYLENEGGDSALRKKFPHYS